MIKYSIYIVDDESTIRNSLEFALGKTYEVRSFLSAEDALSVIPDEPPDLVLLDIGLPGMNGIEALEKIKAIDYNVLVIMITAFEDIKTVISAMKRGPYDYLVKPVEMEALKISIKNALESTKLRKEIQLLQEKYLKENIPCFIGESDSIQDVMEFVSKVAESRDTPILITGESGTGKELIASAIHYKSPNFKGNFVAVNCAAIPKDLIESELFGYEKGAFSGASAAGKKGMIEQAEHGTLFLDEVGDLSLEAQAKLLRFLQEGEFYRVGGTRKQKVDTRVVSATNKDLNAMIKEGFFRLDLFYRLAVIQVEIPSLNQRRNDILPIAKSFLIEFCEKHGKKFNTISSDTESFLVNHTWEGNIRELRNLIERGVLVGTGPELTMADIGQGPEKLKTQPIPNPSEGQVSFPPIPDDGFSLEELNAFYIQEALEKAKGNDAKAAQLLGMPYYAFRYQRKKLLNT